MNFYIELQDGKILKVNHLQEKETGYRIFLYVFYVSAFMMTSILIFGVYAMLIEWEEKGTYVMGEVLVTTEVPFENFAKLSTWLFFSIIISWYCVSRIGWKKTTTINSWKLALTQLMLLGFCIICLYEVLYNFTVLNAQISAGVINGQVPDIDSLVVAYPDPTRPWNLIFATKIFLGAFLISAHAFYLSTRPRKGNETEA